MPKAFNGQQNKLRPEIQYKTPTVGAVNPSEGGEVNNQSRLWMFNSV